MTLLRPGLPLHIHCETHTTKIRNTLYNLSIAHLRYVVVFVFSVAFPILAMLVSFPIARADSLTTLPSGSLSRVYGGVNAGPSVLEPDDSDSTVKASNRNSVATGLFLGLDVSSHVSSELYYNDLGSAKLTVPGGLKYKVAGVSGLFYMSQDSHRLGSRQGLSAYGRLGVGQLYNQSRASVTQDNKFHLMLGLGLEYGWRSGIALRAEAISYDKDANYAGLSILYRAITKEQPLTVAAVPVTPIPSKAVTEKPPIIQTRKSFPSTVFFDDGSSFLRRDALSPLSGIATDALADKDVVVIVRAYADTRGSELYNMWISERRGRRVAEYLSKLGIPGNRIIVYAYGETSMFDGSSTEKALGANRRADIVLLR